MIKSREMWAVVSPSGMPLYLRETKWSAIHAWVEDYAGDAVVAAGYNKAWKMAKKRGYRCVKVRVTVEEICQKCSGQKHVTHTNPPSTTSSGIVECPKCEGTGKVKNE